LDLIETRRADGRVPKLNAVFC